MKSWLRGIGWVAVLVCTSAACGDSSSPGGASGAGGSGGSGGSDGGDICANPDAGTLQTVVCVTVNSCEKVSYTGAAAPTYLCTPGKSTKYPDGPNSCRNEVDCMIINTGLVRDMVRTCALSYRDREPAPGASEPERIAACKTEADLNTACVKDATATKIMQPGISDACGKCYTQIALCSIAFCLADCSANADAIECVKCQFDNGCRVPFEKCSGVDRQE